METKLRLFHSEGGYDLVRPADVPEGVETLGEYSVETRDGAEVRQKINSADIQTTDVALPEGYEPTPTALMHLVQTLTDRHSDMDRITQVAVLEGDAKLGARVAALLDAEVIEAPVTTEVQA